MSGYEIVARFSAVDGLKIGDDVGIGGIKIGSVVSAELDPETYLAVLHLSIDPSYQLDQDTVAAVVTEGLLGGKYVKLDGAGTGQ